jgi:hypothetical protein
LAQLRVDQAQELVTGSRIAGFHPAQRLGDLVHAVFLKSIVIFWSGASPPGHA